MDGFPVMRKMIVRVKATKVTGIHWWKARLRKYGLLRFTTATSTKTSLQNLTLNVAVFPLRSRRKMLANHPKNKLVRALS